MYKVFINDREIILTGKKPENPANDSVIIKIGSEREFWKEVKTFLIRVQKKNNVLYVINDNSETLLSYLEKYAVYMEAAGGLVINPQNELLFIYRYGKWDLPKGKKEPGENPELTAIREVKEECSIGDIEIIETLTSTYHMYLLPSEQWVLKKTFWYLMHAGDWKDPKPQLDEDISKAIWVNPLNAKDYLSNTYSSIRMLVKTYFKKMD